jgi:hypothetical protein
MKNTALLLLAVLGSSFALIACKAKTPPAPAPAPMPMDGGYSSGK